MGRHVSIMPVSQGYVFPGMRVSHTHIPRDACFPTHMCVQGKCVSPKISPNSLQFSQASKLTTFIFCMCVLACIAI